MAQISLPYKLNDGTVAKASHVMANFNAIVNVVNGNLDSGNLKSISGSDVTVNDLNGGTTTLNNFIRRFQAGRVSFENVPSNVYMSKNVKFPRSFPGEPYIVLGLRTGTPDVVHVGYSDVSRSGFKLHVKNDYANTRTIEVSWIAVYVG